ncbi:hypothetical protein KAR48_02520 [bacterium]|nr:hypothetical protein [bacterium]
MHEGSEIIENQRIKETLDRFIFISDGPHCNRFSNMSIGDSRFDGKEPLQLSVKNFCKDIISGFNEWLDYNKDNDVVKTNLLDMLEIHDNGFSIRSAIKFEKK